MRCSGKGITSRDHLENALLSGQKALSALAILDVGCRSVPFDDVPRLVTQRHAADQEPAIFPVGGPSQPRFIVERLPRLQGGAPFLHMLADVFGMKFGLPSP